MPKKKHAKNMTTDEAVKHLFHAKIVKHAKDHIAQSEQPKPRKRAK
jgi:hypothetical protein